MTPGTSSKSAPRSAEQASTLTVDTANGVLEVTRAGESRTVDLYSTEGFELLSELWLKVGWNQKHVYTFSWLGRPIIQLPEDLVRIQELLYDVQPDVIVECGVAHGGSLVYYASLCKLFGKGRVVGIDVDIRSHNRVAIEQHPLSDLITLIEGSSTDSKTLSHVAREIRPDDLVLVILDSNHTRDHVLAELESYSEFVTLGSYIVVMDGIMQLVFETPRGQSEWSHDNPISAVHEFLKHHSEFELHQPARPFNESDLRSDVTHWPDGYLRRVA